MADKRGAAEASLAKLVGADGLMGAALVGRDGLPVMSRFARPVQPETFSAMSAALLGAAEAAIQELSEEGTARATIEAGSIRLVVTGLDKDYLFVAAGPSSLGAARMTKLVDDAVSDLRKILGG